MLRKNILLILIFVSLISFTSAIDYYVSPTGSDANTGLTYGTPFQTFKPALQLVQPGDTVYALGGTYGVSNLMPNINGGGTSFISLWGNDGYSSGNSTHPITIRNYPGENPILDGTTISNSAIWLEKKSHYSFEGFEFTYRGIYIEGDDTSTYNITIRNNYFHHIDAGSEGSNTGMIVIYRDYNTDGGTKDIFIINNTFHDLERAGVTWESIPDAKHTGVLTVLSVCSYSDQGIPCYGTQNIHFINNTIYNVSQTFFMKNPAAGPWIVTGNVIHDVDRLGILSMSNMYMANNLVYNFNTGWVKVGITEGSSGVDWVRGQNQIIINNTFVGADGIMSIGIGTNHTLRNNIYFGIINDSNTADSPAYLAKDWDADDGADPALSLLQNITSDNNCFIVPSMDVNFVSRKWWTPTPGSKRYNYSEQLPVFGFDANSIFITESNPDNFFVDPASANYRLQNPGLCPNMGYYASESPTVPICEATVGTCYYLDAVNGNDGTGDGSFVNPWQTVRKVASISSNYGFLLPGDYVYLMNGTYNQVYATGDGDVGNAVGFFRIDGTQANPITITAYPGEKPLLDGAGSPGIGIKGDYYVFSGLEIKSNGGSTCFYLIGTGNIIENNEIHTCGGAGGGNPAAIKIKEFSFRNIVRNNHLHDIYATVAPSHNSPAIMVFGGNGLVIHNNLIHDASAGIRYKHPAVPEASELPSFEVYRNIIYNMDGFAIDPGTNNARAYQNIIYNSYKGFKIDEIDTWPYSFVQNISVFENSIFNVTSSGLQSGSNQWNDACQCGVSLSRNTTYRDNAVHSQTFVFQYWRDYDLLSSDYNCYNIDIFKNGYAFTNMAFMQGLGHEFNSIISTNQFVDPGNLNFTLTPTSPCRNSGSYGQHRGAWISDNPDYEIGIIGGSPPVQPSTCHDVNTDGKVNIFDVALVLANQGRVGPDYSHLDIDVSGVVDMQDVNAVIRDFGRSC